MDILEIGTFKGNATAAFYFYFKNAKIYSADIFPDLFSYTSDRIKNFYVDSSSEKSISHNILKRDKKFEIIIEDAFNLDTKLLSAKKAGAKLIKLLEEVDDDVEIQILNQQVIFNFADICIITKVIDNIFGVRTPTRYKNYNFIIHK